MKKKFALNILLLVFLNLLVKPFWIFGIDRTVQNITGAEQYGAYFSILSFSLLFGILLDLGITNFSNRDVARYHQLVTKYLSNMLGFKLLLGFVYFVVTALVAFLIGYGKLEYTLLLPIVLNQFLHSLNVYLRSNLSALQYYKTDSLLSVLDRILLIALCSLLIWGGLPEVSFSIHMFVYAQTAVYIFSFFIILFIVLRKTGFVRVKLERTYVTYIVRKGFPFALLSLLMVFYYRVDSVMLERMLSNGAYVAGIYAQSFRVLDAVGVFPYLFSTLLLPMFSKMLKEDALTEVTSLSRLAFTLVVIPAVFIVLIVYRYCPKILGLLYVQGHEGSVDVFRVLIMGFLPMSCSYIFGTLLTAAGRLRELNILAGAALVLNVSLNSILIPFYAAQGAAIASLITLTCMAIVQLIMAYRLLHFSFSLRDLLKLMIYVLSLLLLLYFLPYVFVDYYVQVIVLASMAIVLIFVYKLLNLRSIILFFQGKVKIRN